MNNVSRVRIETLTESRLDANYYAVRFLNNEKILANCGIKRERISSISELCNCGATPVEVNYGEKGVGLIRTSDVRPNKFKANGVLRTEDISLKDLRASVIAKPGDLLYTMSGTIGYACVLPADSESFSFSNTISRVRLPVTSTHDAHYIATFFNCRYGYEQSLRLVSGGIQGHVMPNPFKDLLIPLPKTKAQNYIGSKIRAAEKMQAWAKQTEALIAEEFAPLVSSPLSPMQFWRASPMDLDPYRINPKQYDPVVLELINRARKNGYQLQSLYEIFGKRQMSGGATPKGADYFDEGVFFARVQNVKPLSLDLSDAVYIDKAADNELARSRCTADDIILSITGYPGTASLVTEDDLPVNINQHSVRFDVKADVYPGFVCAALNSRFLKYQVDRLAIGGTRDALDYPSVSRLLIPRFSADVEKAIDESVRDFVAAVKYAQRLTLAAKLLVEALIEGRVSEAELTSAQQGLDVGNDQADFSILQRIKVDGVDGEGTPLFPDLDKLCELLAQVQD